MVKCDFNHSNGVGALKLSIWPVILNFFIYNLNEDKVIQFIQFLNDIKIGFWIGWHDGLKIIKCNATEINIIMVYMYTTTMQSIDFGNFTVIKINVRF